MFETRRTLTPMLVLAQKELHSLWVFGFPFLCGLTVTEVQFVILLSLYMKLWMRFANGQINGGGKEMSSGSCNRQ